MASTVLPNGIIVPEKFSRDWYADLYHNWQELDNLLGGGTPKDGTLTIQKNGATVGTFSANQATDKTINIEVPDVNDATLTIQQNGTTVDTFTANSSSDKTVNIQCVDLTNNQTVGGNKEFTGTTTAHDVIPSATDTYNFGSPSYQWNNAYIKSLAINGVACGDILTHNVSEFVDVSSNQTIGGVKTWTAQQKYAGNNTRGVLSVYNSSYTKGSAVSVTDLSIGTIFMGDGGNTGLTNSLGFISCDLADTGNRSMLSISAIKNEASSGARANLIIEYDKSDTTSPERIRCKGEVLPNSNNFYSLGTSTNKWKSVNGVNPGALSLPSNSYVNIDTTDWVLDGSNVNIFTPTSDGWLGIQATDTVYDQMHYIFVGRNDSASYHSQNILSPVNGLWSSSYHGCVFIPVIKNVRYDIRCICNSIVATFYPCQGNV